MKNATGVPSRKQAMFLMTGRTGDLGLSGPDRAFAHRMHREAVVWRRRLDYSLSALSDRPLDSLDIQLLTCLRIGAVQLLILDVPPHAAVSATVALLRKRRKRAYANAVLRKLAAEGERTGASAAVMWSHPQDLVERWFRRYGEEDALRLLEWNNSVPDLGFWPVKPVGTGDPGDDLPGEPGRLLQSYRRIRRGALGDVLDSARFFVQDESAAIVGSSAASLPAEHVLEIGCAPGGKTVHLQRPGRGTVSVDSSESRIGTWVENRDRFQWSDCLPVVAEGENLPFAAEGFDLVLVDAPCTGTGVYRRRFDSRWNWSSGLLDRCTATQRRLLDSAAAMTCPGGLLVYSTCSLEPEENTGQVSAFENGHPGFRRITFPAASQLVSEGLLSIFPPEHDMDGMFAAAWKRAE